MSDKIKLALSIVLIAAGVVAYHQLASASIILRTGAVVLGLVLAAAVALTTEQGRVFVGFSKESVAEARKVVWPTRKESWQITGVVIVLVLFVAIFLWIVDGSLNLVLNWLLRRGN